MIVSVTTHSFANVYYLATSVDPSIGKHHVRLHWSVGDLYVRSELLINMRKRVSCV